MAMRDASEMQAAGDKERWRDAEHIRKPIDATGADVVRRDPLGDEFVQPLGEDGTMVGRDRMGEGSPTDFFVFHGCRIAAAGTLHLSEYSGGCIVTPL